MKANEWNNFLLRSCIINKVNTRARHLHQEPVEVDAREFTAMNRRRYYWGNIPGTSFNPLEPSVNFKQCYSYECTIFK